MSRTLDDLQVSWKLNLSATVAGKLEFMLSNPITKKPIYGARVRLVEALLEDWIAKQEGRPGAPVPDLAQLRGI